MKMNNLPWYLTQSFCPVHLESLVLWVNTISHRGTRWMNLALLFANRNHGTIYDGMRNSAIHPNGIFGSGLIFDGVNDYSNHGNDASLNIIDAISIEAWVKFNDYTEESKCIIGKGEGWDDGYDSLGPYYLGMYSGSLYWDKWSTSYNRDLTLVSMSGIVSNNVWTHIVVTWDGTKSYIYFDGLEKASENADFSQLNTNTENLYIGGELNVGRFFNGTQGEVRIYNIALTPSEIKHNYMHSLIYYRERGVELLSLLR